MSSATGTETGVFQERRAERLAELVAERELDLLLVSEPHDIRYLTGFTGTNGLALVGAGERAFITDFRYVEQAAAQVSGYDRVRGERDLLGTVAERAGTGKRLGFDDEHLTVATHRRLGEQLPQGTELVAAGGAVGKLRAVKEPDELRAIAAAAELADQAYAGLREAGLAGRTEREVAEGLALELGRLGSEGPSFPIIVAAAGHGALPHAEPRNVEIPRDALVVVDMGCVVDGYCSDCTRTLATGEIGDEARAVYDLVLEAQLAALAAVRAGAGCVALDRVARDAIERAGHGDEFGHGLGHGVGLEVHEGPRLAPRAEGALAAGNVVTVEPGVYLPGRFGVRIEDLVAVTEDGHDVYTQFPKELTVI